MEMEEQGEGERVGVILEVEEAVEAVLVVEREARVGTGWREGVMAEWGVVVQGTEAPRGM